MGRIHLFEFEDQKWFPSFLRNYLTDFLQFLSNKTKLYKPIIPFLEEAIKEMNDLVNNLENNSKFNWKIGRMKSGPGVVLYLIGTLKK